MGLVEGYMFCCKIDTNNLEESLTQLVSEVRKAHPKLKFNTCLVSEQTIFGAVWNIDGILIIPYQLPKDHYWFVLDPILEKSNKDDNAENWSPKE